MKRRFLPYGRQSIDDADIAAMVAAMKGEFLTTGPMVEKFESAFAAKVGAADAVVCSSGTAGLHMAAHALGLRQGELAIVPTLTFLATANCVRYVGGDVIFADVDPQTGLITEETVSDALRRACGRRIKALFAVHLSGRTADMRSLRRLAGAHGMSVVEDACHAVGGSVDGAPVGACTNSDLAVFSAHPVKTITMGEGGVVATADRKLAANMRAFRSHGMVRDPKLLGRADFSLDASGGPNPWAYEMHDLGYNYRATDIQCALGLSQLEKLDHFVRRRRALVARYVSRLAGMAPLVVPTALGAPAETAWHLCSVLIDFHKLGRTRADVMRKLAAEGIGTQVHYIPVHRQPYYEGLYGRQHLSGADEYYERALSLPLFVGMLDEDIDFVVSELLTALGLQ